ncbi:MAG: DUF1286 domain-containing protein [Saccharolobus sp.]
MKLQTHAVFSTGLLTLINSLFTDFNFSLILAAIISIIANLLIDMLGHEKTLTRYGYIPTRTPRTHTVYRSIAWGILSAIIPLALFTLTQSTYEYNYYHLIPLMIIDGIIVGPSHMFLDAFTEAGIFVKKNGKWKRAAIAHFSYDNKVLNGLAILAGIIMLIISAKAY